MSSPYCAERARRTEPPPTRKYYDGLVLNSFKAGDGAPASNTLKRIKNPLCKSKSDAGSSKFCRKAERSKNAVREQNPEMYSVWRHFWHVPGPKTYGINKELVNSPLPIPLETYRYPNAGGSVLFRVKKLG